MTEDQMKQYEEAAKSYLKTLKGREYKSLYEFAIQQKSAFILGCSHAHSKIEEAEREAHNRAIEEAIIIANTFTHAGYKQDTQLIIELKKLRK